jgi:MFS family permease
LNGYANAVMMMMMTKKRTRRRNENDDYSTILSSPTSQASTIATTTAISSSKNNGDCKADFPTESSAVNKGPHEETYDTEHNENDDSSPALVIDIEEAIDRLGMGMFQFQIILACGLCFASDAMEVLLLYFLALILQSQWGLSEGQSDSIVSVVFVGAMLGTLVLTPLGDKWGRRIIFAVTAATISFFGILTAFCNTYPQILMVRFMVGFGVGGLTVPYDALGEFMPSSRRGKNMLATSFFWTTGSLLVPLFAWLTIGRNSNKDNNSDGINENTPPEEGSWRAFVMLCALPSAVSTVLGIWFVPESPRWLLTRGKHEKSLQILRHAAAKNGKDPYLTFPEKVRLVDRNTNGATNNNIRTDNESSSSSMSMPTDNDDNSDDIGDGIQRDNVLRNEGRPHNQKFYTDDEADTCSEFALAPTSDQRCLMCSNPQWRRISFLLGGQWYGLAFMYYGAIMTVSIVFSNIQKDDDNENNDDNNNGKIFDFDYGALFITSSAEIAGLSLAILMVDRVGRVTTQIWAYSLGGFCLLLLGILDFYVVRSDPMNGVDQGEEVASQRLYLILFAFLSRMFIMGATSVTWLHTAELLPTRFRATGHGLGE